MRAALAAIPTAGALAVLFLLAEIVGRFAQAVTP